MKKKMKQFEPWKTLLENLEGEPLSELKPDLRLERPSAAEGPAELQQPGDH